MSRHLTTPAGDGAVDERRTDAGFTLVELLVVVLILGVLLAVGAPTLQGAMQRSSDRKAQSHVRQAYVGQLTYATEAQAFTDDAPTLTRVDGSLDYTADLTVLSGESASPRTVYVEVTTDSRPDDTVFVGVRSKTGSCYWMKATLSTPVSFAVNDCSALPAPAELTTRW